MIRGEGNGGVATKLVSHPGTVAYINLADARANAGLIPPAGGAGTSVFWVEVETAKTPKKNRPTLIRRPTARKQRRRLPTAKKPSTRTAGKNSHRRRTEEPWNEVSTAKVQKHYPICGFTFDLSLTKFKGVKGSAEEPTAGSVRTAFDYLKLRAGDRSRGRSDADR